MNIILMEIYDEYQKSKNITKLEEFTLKTFPQDGTDKLFMACTLILINNVYKTRVNAETLKTVVLSIKENVGDTNLLKIYFDRVNGDKMVSKYLSKVINDKNILKYADLILDYLDSLSFDFIKMQGVFSPFFKRKNGKREDSLLFRFAHRTAFKNCRAFGAG